MPSSTVPPESPRSSSTARQAPWLRLLLFLGVLLLGLAALRWEAHRAVLTGEHLRLSAEVEAMDTNLAWQLQGVHAALLAVRQDAMLEASAPRIDRELQVLSDAMPGVRSLQVLDAAGRARHASLPSLVGRDFGERRYFQRARSGNDPALAYLSPPSRSELEIGSLTLGVVLRDAAGRFNGMVAASLDPDYFRAVLGAALYAPDMQASVIHAQGEPVMAAPVDGAAVAQADGAGPGAPPRLWAVHTLKPSGLPLDHGLVLVLSRDEASLLAPWRETTAIYALFWLLLAGGSAIGLGRLQRRYHALEAVRLAAEQRRQEDAERLAMALNGADLGLWDLDLVAGNAVVNERWAAMLGLRREELEPGPEHWRRRVHPEDWPWVSARQQAHVDGETPQFEATYRMRHREGHWVWILDRGKVIERDAQGRPLRMAGTHMDITERMQAQQALERSERSLEVTLHSIGDAVIATDPQGIVTRINATGERLTGWAATEAVGRPLSSVFRIFNAETGAPAVDPVQQVIARGKTVGLANGTRLASRDGSGYQIADSAAPIRTPQGEVLGVVLVFSDVTAQYEVQQTLRDRERQLSAVAEALPGPVSRVDADGRYLYASSAYARWFGRPLSQVIGRTQRELLGAHYAAIEPFVRRALAGERVQYETPFVSALGSLHALVTLVPDRDDGGRVRGHFTIFTDISERKQAEDALRISEHQTRALLDILGSGVVVHAADTRILDSNPAASRILGLSREQMQGKQAIDPRWMFLEEDGSPMPLARYPVNQVLASGQVLENFVLGLRLPGLAQPRWVLASALPVRDGAAIVQVVVTFADVTERIQAEEQLRLLEAAVARLNDIVLITEVDADPASPPRIVYANGAFERVTGYALPEVLGRSPSLLQGPQTDAGEIARIGAAVRRREPVRGELLNYGRSGQPYWVELDIVPLGDRSGRVTHMVAVQRDISGRKQADARLRAAQDELAATLAAVPDLLFEIALDGRIEVYHSPRKELLYRPAEQQIGHTVDEVLPSEAAAQIHQALAEAQANGFSGGRRYALPLPQGLHWFEISVAPKAVPAGATPRFILLARDISDRQRAEDERRDLEAQLRESQKMEAIGTLAGGIAHDFNNIIAGILGNVALARQDLGPAHAAAASLAQIERAGLRARTLVRQILTFSRREAVQPVTLRLRDVMEESLALLRATAPPGVHLAARLADEPIGVRGDATQLQQVLMNLCVNAWHALPESGGQVEVGLDASAVDARLWVRDDGAGMDEATLAHIFDPFFTTKSAGQGTGLGLAVVHGIVLAHEGRIHVESRPGAGSRFEVRLPRVELGPEVAVGVAAVAPLPSGRGQHVLYVDDDEILRQVVQRLLERAGWRVTACADAEQALAELAQGSRDAALLITDMNMPGASGLSLCQKVATLRPGLPMVIFSGQVSDELLARSRAAGVHRVLAKEELLDTLRDAVAALLGPGQGGS